MRRTTEQVFYHILRDVLRIALDEDRTYQDRVTEIADIFGVPEDEPEDEP
jgi:hypothetical protein